MRKRVKETVTKVILWGMEGRNWGAAFDILIRFLLLSNSFKPELISLTGDGLQGDNLRQFVVFSEAIINCIPCGTGERFQVRGCVPLKGP